jgi:segregation and condensation protein A
MSDPSLPRVETEVFAGPLDLLLDEVRRQQVAIEHIALAPVVARFLEYVRTAPARQLNLDIEWLHMAATLIHWKSRALLPRDPTVSSPEPADPLRDELIRQLVGYRKEAAAELARRQANEQRSFSRFEDGSFREREPGGPCGDGNEEDGPGFVSVWDLRQQARELARWVAEYRTDQRRWQETMLIRPNDVTIEEMIAWLRDRFGPDAGEIDGSVLLDEQPTPSHRACTFLAILEMARNREVKATQHEPFGSISLTRTRADV